MKFIEIPINDQSKVNRKLVCGVGVNDAAYKTEISIDGSRYFCPFYIKWSSMINRCYNKKRQKRQPSYNDCYVAEEWLLFSTFKSWMEKLDWHGKALDKDLLSQGNNVYSPEKCIFVSSEINNLIGTCKSRRGKYPQGVSFYKRDKTFKAQVCTNGKQTHIGYFDTSELAFSAYKIAKYKLIKLAAEKQEEPLKSALLNHKILEH